MEPKELKTRDAARVARHRKRIATSGARRVEVTVAAQDAPLVKTIADNSSPNATSRRGPPPTAQPYSGTATSPGSASACNPLDQGQHGLNTDEGKSKRVTIGRDALWTAERTPEPRRDASLRTSSEATPRAVPARTHPRPARVQHRAGIRLTFRPSRPPPPILRRDHSSVSETSIHLG